MTEKFKQIWEQSNVVDDYGKESPLFKAEECYLKRYFKPGMKVLNLGCGGGRFASAIYGEAGLLKGVDISSEMVDSFLRRFPRATAECCPMEAIEEPENEYDLVVIPYNSLDCVEPKDKRLETLRRVFHCLKPGGVLVFSSHNPLGDFGGWIYSFRPGTLLSVFERILRGYSFKAECYLPERLFNFRVPMYYARDHRVVSDVESLGFEGVEQLGASFGSPKPMFYRWFEFWIYYAFRKPPA